MNTLTYKEIKEILKEDCLAFMKEEQYTAKQAIARLLEDSVVMMKEDVEQYIFTIVSLTCLSIQHNYIPSYLVDRIAMVLSSLKTSYIRQCSPAFIRDMTMIQETLAKKQIEIIEDEFKYRVDLLLEEREKNLYNHRM